MGKTILLSVFAILAFAVLFLAQNAYATTVFTLDQSTCTSILYPGSWDATTNTCTLTGTVNFGTNGGPHVLELFIPSGNTLTISGNTGFIFDFDTIANNGTINLVNQGGLAVTNGGVLNNNGVVNNNANNFQNGAGTINNNVGATINNNGLFWNYFATINNRGTINPGSDLENRAGGTINNICPGVINGNIIETGGSLVNQCSLTGTTTTVSSSQNPSTFGQSVSFTATISPTPDSGTVQFQSDGANLGSPVAVTSGTATSAGMSNLANGSHTITAIYSGSTNFATSTGTLTQTVNQLVCLAGSYLSGSVCIPAPAGSYVPTAGATSSTLCPAGTFTDTTGQSVCTLAPAGSYVGSTGATSAALCPAGTFTDTTGQSVCTLAPAGSYVGSTGATSSTFCPAGTFTDTTGQSVCTLAPAGSYVGSTGATSAALCPAGTYQPNMGQNSCIPASPGFYVNITGAIQQTQCPAGTTSDVEGSISCHAVSTAGKVTGGGNIGKDQDFGFEVSSKDGKTFKGNMEYHAKTSDVDIKGTTITQLFVDSSMTHAIFAGQASVDSAHHHDVDKKKISPTYTFLINVTDVDKTGNHDTFSITITNSTGNVTYQNSGTVRGHIEIHHIDTDDDSHHH